MTLQKFITGVLLHGENLFNQLQFTGLFADASNNFDVNWHPYWIPLAE